MLKIEIQMFEKYKLTILSMEISGTLPQSNAKFKKINS
jgi:hypothetical protein